MSLVTGVETGQPLYFGASTINISVHRMESRCTFKEVMERNPKCMYRIVRVPQVGRWKITVFQGAKATLTASYTHEALPDWIRKDVALLSMVHHMDAIPSIGHRVGDAYWLQPKDKDESCTGV